MITADHVAVGTTATQISTDERDSRAGTRILVRVPSGASVSVFLGGSLVTTSNGVELAPGESYSDALERGEPLYAVASQEETVEVLQGGL